MFSSNKCKIAKKGSYDKELSEGIQVCTHGHLEDVTRNVLFDVPQTSMVSVEGLAKLVDPSQLTDDFEGSLDYNHEEWMDLRVSLEDFMSNAVHLLSRLEDLQVSRRVRV